ncbi:MAG: hypothetical protein ABI661_00935 [Gammaproteobacteria bacterium]
MVLADKLVLRRGERRTERAVTPGVYHALKAAAHGPVAVYALLNRQLAGTRDGSLNARLNGLSRRLAAALVSARSEIGDATEADTVCEVLAATLAFAKREHADPAELEAFAGALGPGLLRLTDYATRHQISSLHTATESILLDLTSQERGQLRVVVAGVHQARARSLSLQYFNHRLHEPEGIEERVTFAEGVTTEREVLALVGTQRLDRAIAGAFFGDPKRLQQDVLGDAAQRLLMQMELPPI